MYKTLRKLHLWLSVPFGIIISVICFTGMLLVFEPSHTQGGHRPEFFLDVMRIHRWLYDAPAVKGDITVGKITVAISVIAMLFILVTGIAMWCIRARHSLSPNLKIAVGKGTDRFLSTLHTSGGIYAVSVLLLLAFTGLTWSFGWYRAGFSSLFGIEKGSHIVYEIHSGNIGGVITKAIWLVCAFLGSTLPLTGYYLWIHRIRMAHKKTKRI